MRYRIPLVVALGLLLGQQLLAQTRPAAPPANGPATAPAPAAATPAPESPKDATEEWIQATKHPVSWLTWGADQRLRDEYLNNAKGLDKDAPGHEINYGRFRTRLWTTVTPVKDLDINARLIWEFRTYSEPEGLRDVDLSDALFDTLNITWKNIGGTKSKAIIGRQDIILGDGWLVLDGTPLDGSRTIYFDAVRGVWDFESAKTTLDTIYIDQSGRENRWIEPFNFRPYVTALNAAGDPIQKQNLLMEQDERGAILWLTNKSFDKTELNAYFIYKHDQPLVSTLGETDVYTTGVRGVKDFTENWRARAELAQQLGRRYNVALDEDQSICALGGKALVEYFVRDPMNHTFRAGYEFLSGDDPDTKGTNEGWDPLWGRWPQWSEIYANTMALDNGRPAFYQNMHRIQFGHTFSPVKKLDLVTDYHLLFRDESVETGAINPDGLFRGQLLTWLAKYKHNEHISSHFLAEFFFPGNFYRDSNNDVATFLRYEIVFTW